MISDFFSQLTSGTASSAPAIVSAAHDNLAWMVSVMQSSLGLCAIKPIAIAVAFFSVLGTLTIGGSVLPQTIDTLKNKQTQSFSTLMYIFLVVGCFCLGIYGIGLVCAGDTQTYTYTSADNATQIYAALSAWAAAKWAGTNEAINTALVNAYKAFDTAQHITVITAASQLTNMQVLSYVLTGKTIAANTGIGALLTTSSFNYAYEALLAGSVNFAIGSNVTGAALGTIGAGSAVSFSALGDTASLSSAIGGGANGLYGPLMIFNKNITESGQTITNVFYTGLVNNRIITPGAAFSAEANFTTAGGVLILGEFFASLTSAMVLWIKIANVMKAKQQGKSENDYCIALLAELQARREAKKGAVR